MCLWLECSHKGASVDCPVWTAAVRDTSKASAGLANMGKEAVTLMEADSMYAFFLEGSRQSYDQSPSNVATALVASAEASPRGTNARDICSSLEEIKFNDEESGVIVRKRIRKVLHLCVLLPWIM